MIKRWSGTGGYREVLAVGLPLVVSMGSSTVMLFTDRMFLANYSVDAIAAALPAGIASFLFVCFFMGVGGYVNVFVAQYTGARRGDRVGASLWQGVYLSLIAGALLASLYFLADQLFAAGGHPPEVRRLEAAYFRILTLGGGLMVMAVTLSCFYSGRGLTRPVMLVNLIGAALNIPLDYALINGVWGFPEMGISGAALATVAAQGLMSLLFAALIFRPANEREFNVWSARRFDPELFRRLLRFGAPGGIQFFVDIFAFTFFIFMVGRLGKPELAATNIVFTINTLAFLPMMGFSVAVSTLVGQSIGRGRPDQGVRSAMSAVHITLAYMTVVAAVFLLLPHWLLNLFRPRGFDSAEFAVILATGVVLLRFVAVYSVIDAVVIIFFGALKGAGDIWFAMWAMALAALALMVIPVYLGVEYLGLGLRAAYLFITCYVTALAVTFYWRFQQGKWQGMTVMETPPLGGKQ